MCYNDIMKNKLNEKYLSTKECAAKWGISERSVRNYCANNRVKGAILDGGIWFAPSFAEKPERSNKSMKIINPLLKRLVEEKQLKITGGIYHKIQIELTYNSNHIEGSKLTHDETRYIYETKTIKVSKTNNVDDVVETINHFKCVDMVIDNAAHILNETFIKRLHATLKNGTTDSRISWFRVGDYKKLPNEVGGRTTTEPMKVKAEIKKLLEKYNAKAKTTFDDLLDFHYRFEKIHPFQDGNGRVGRLILFKECLKNNIIPFIITDELKYYYYRGLDKWPKDKNFLRDTCLTAEDEFKKYLKYFKIETQ